MQPTRTIMMAPRSVVSASSSVSQETRRERDTKGSLIDYEPHKIKRTVLSTTVAELYAFMKCYGFVTTATSTRLLEQKETIHVIQMIRQEACSGQMHDLAHVLTQHCLADPLTKKSVSPTLLISTVQTGILHEVDTHPPFRTGRAFVTEIVYPDGEATEDYWAHLMCYPIFFKIQKGTNVSALIDKGGKSPLIKDSLTGRCFLSATGPGGTRTTSTTLEKPCLA